MKNKYMLKISLLSVSLLMGTAAFGSCDRTGGTGRTEFGGC